MAEWRAERTVCHEGELIFPGCSENAPSFFYLFGLFQFLEFVETPPLPSPPKKKKEEKKIQGKKPLWVSPHPSLSLCLR